MTHRNYRTLIYIVLGLSIILNVYFISDNGEKAFSDVSCDTSSDWIDYAVTRRLDKQGDIFQAYTRYLKQVRQDKAYFDEFIGYCKAAGTFCQGELMTGAFQIESEKAADGERIRYLFHRISVCGILYLDETQLRMMDDAQLLQLQLYYEELTELMNRNKTHGSLAYYVLIDDYDSEESRKMQLQTLAIIDQIDLLLDSVW